MKQLQGVEYVKRDQYSVIVINFLSDDLKCILRSKLSEICHGYDLAHNSNSKLFDYKSTIRELLKRYATKKPKIQMGMIGELLVHMIFAHYFCSLRPLSMFFNMEERSIKKGFDIVLSDVKDHNIVWITEVKSGARHINKNSDQTMNDLIGTAKRDLITRLNNDSTSLWLEAVHNAKCTLDSNKNIQSAILSVINSFGEKAINNNYTSLDANVILAGVLFSSLDDKINVDLFQNKRSLLESKKKFNRVYILAIQKNTYLRVYNFLKEELNE